MQTRHSSVLAALALGALCFASGCLHYCTDDLSLARSREPRGGVGSLGIPGVSGMLGPNRTSDGLAVLVDAIRPEYGVCVGWCCADKHREGEVDDCSCSEHCPCHTGVKFR